MNEVDLIKMRDFFERQLWECENTDVDTLDDACIFSNYWGGLNEDRPGMFVIIPSDAGALLLNLIGTNALRREGPLCNPEMFTDSFDPTRDTLFFPLLDLSKTRYTMTDLPTLHVIVCYVIDFILQTMKAHFDFTKVKQDALVRTFFTALWITGGSIGTFEYCVDIPDPHRFLRLLEKIVTK